ncbi:hypothetical protein QBC34DRAFT_86701 [Podospora aff. communis PSN243]|uniref:Uncharacterized protein n=1 Tax=Podospora aff. communis PSN243 TaxID=3040156 RepID=A0AAV9GNU4_9PEZI|nr:hypothetical protein QBC34DRAFT_86701 [Podospora aff. communis PSN243]
MLIGLTWRRRSGGDQRRFIFFVFFYRRRRGLLAKEGQPPSGYFQGLRQLLGQLVEVEPIPALSTLIGLSVRNGRSIGSRKPWFDPCWWDGFRRLRRSQGVGIAEQRWEISRGWGQVRMEASVEADARLLPLIQKSDVSESPVIACPSSPTVQRGFCSGARPLLLVLRSRRLTDRRRARFSCVAIFVPRESTQHGDYRCPFLEHASGAARPTLQWSPFGFEIQSEEVSLLLAGDQRFLLASTLSLSRCIGPEVDQRGQSRCVCDGDPFARGPRTPGLDVKFWSVCGGGTQATRLAVSLQQRLPSYKPRCATPW